MVSFFFFLEDLSSTFTGGGIPFEVDGTSSLHEESSGIAIPFSVETSGVIAFVLSGSPGRGFCGCEVLPEMPNKKLLSEIPPGSLLAIPALGEIA